jgi:hypothetical protein
MRFARSALALCVLLLAIPSWGKQASQSASTPQPASDPQAVAVVQAAITALGGATAISQAQSWTFQAEMQGSFGNANVSYAMSTDTDTGTIVLADGTTRAVPAGHSHFVPALVAAILLRESQDPEFSLHFGGLSTLDSKPVTVIIFSAGPIQFPSQTWYFDAANLPVQVDFRLSAVIGARQSHYGLVSLSDYRSVSGVLYPFRMIAFSRSGPPQIVTLQSLSISATASTNQPNAAAGDSR